jgi:hypothetical protein
MSEVLKIQIFPERLSFVPRKLRLDPTPLFEVPEGACDVTLYKTVNSDAVTSPSHNSCTQVLGRIAVLFKLFAFCWKSCS